MKNNIIFTLIFVNARHPSCVLKLNPRSRIVTSKKIKRYKNSIQFTNSFINLRYNAINVPVSEKDLEVVQDYDMFMKENNEKFNNNTIYKSNSIFIIYIVIKVNIYLIYI